jgi:carboxyl-terminal processing protease
MIAILWIVLTVAAMAQPLDSPMPVPQDGVASKPRDYPARLELVAAAVEERFFQDPFERPDYLAAKQTAREAAKTCDDPQQFRDVVNRYLQTLNASHTYYLTPDDWEYYHLAAVFESLPDIQARFQNQPIAYPSIGVILQRQEQRWIVADILPGGPASLTDLRIGDVLLRVNNQPYTPVTVWWPLVDQATVLVVERNGLERVIDITPRKLHPGAELLTALQGSLSVIERDGAKIGYAHFYSYAGRQYHEVLEQAIQSGKFAGAEALVIDLRYGLGGADPNYLSLFNQQVPQLDSIDRGGQISSFNTVWRQPVVLLVNETSRSGKEVLAFGAKRHGLATLVGTRTAGAVLAGSPIVIEGEDLLYLAVRDVLVDGQRLERQGVLPDVEVELDLTTCEGIDRQREAALDEAVKRVRPSADLK